MPAALVPTAEITPDWLDLLTPLSPEETRQRENHSQFDGPDAAHPLDVKLSDEFAREIWGALDEVED